MMNFHRSAHSSLGVPAMLLRPTNLVLQVATMAVVGVAMSLTARVTVWGGPPDILPTGGINLGSYNYFDKGYPFIDAAKMGREWLSTDGRVWSDGRPIELTPNGYPASLAEDQFARTLMFTHNGSNYDLGVYEVTWDGTGTVGLDSANSSITPVFTDTNEIHYDVLATSTQGLLLEVRETDPLDPVHNIRVVPANLKDSGSPFHPSYVQDLQNYGVLRFLDWVPTNGNWISEWDERTTLDKAHWGNFHGIPYERQIELGNELQQDIWLNIPHAASEDYIVQLSRLVDEKLDPNLRVWIEYSNEVWNGSFSQNRYVKDDLRAEYETEFLAEAYAFRASDVFDIVAQELDSDRFVRVAGGWAQTPFMLSKGLPAITDEFGKTNADVAAIAAYFKLTNDEMENLYNRYRVGRVDFDLVFDQLRDAIDVAAESWRDNAVIANDHGLDLVSYEAGHHIVPVTITQKNDEGFVDVLEQIQLHPRMEETYAYLAEKWREIGGTTLILFNNMDPWTNTGSWGLKQGFDDAVTPKFDAVQKYLTSNPGGWDLRTGTWLGDFNGNGVLDVADIDLLTEALANGVDNETLDLNRDGSVDFGDRRYWIEGLKVTYPGDADLDGVISTTDLVVALQFGVYEDDIPFNATWAAGDWDGDREFTSSDLVLALQTGKFDPNAAVANSVPEPASLTLLLLAATLAAAPVVRRRRHPG